MGKLLKFPRAIMPKPTRTIKSSKKDEARVNVKVDTKVEANDEQRNQTTPPEGHEGEIGE